MSQPKRAWRTIAWREGSQGRLRARFVALRCWRQDDLRRWRWDDFHRHAVLVMLAYSFLVWQEWQQRAQRGNPGRRAFPPRPDRQRQSLAAIHRGVLDWLRILAIDELIREGRLDAYRPNQEVTK